MGSLSYDPRDPRVHADPYPGYEALREHDPVHFVPGARVWFLTRHSDCLAVLCDPRLSARHGQRLRRRDTALPTSMLNTDPPDHTRLRRAAAPAFRPRALREHGRWLVPLVGAWMGRVREAARAGREVDLAAEFARPLALRVVAGLLGLPEEDLPDFDGWAGAVAGNLDPFAAPAGGGEAAMAAMCDRFADHLFSRLTAPRPDAFTVLAGACSDGTLAPAEAMATAGLLVVGGVEPLGDMIVNAVAAMLADPGRWRDLAGSGAAPARTATEELLRIDPPIQFTARTATEDLVVGGRSIRRGDGVVPLLGAANRDPARFTRPGRLDLRRRVNPHLSFGAGPHACLGAPLVRMVGRLLVTAVRECTAEPRPGGGPAFHRPGTVPRGYASLPLRWS
ncbi:cytochrome P450 [Streptosporangium becharense]|uniref:Cytochrome P450 n=1 Tax=Streptosporangium becharense TaxID=1816182 RepID=A0A7W9IEF9_9ACTN|nr:cytochrome P450 [Streptosporangium becharense]MBB2909817.1 cytochrome P450 [Streptosporangium becharense]MBB5819228.1 cytochrome P450 [Streptosporangium becharense]